MHPGNISFPDGEAYPERRIKGMWYVIQTITGKEQELVDTMEHIFGGERKEKRYGRCFVLYRECIWRIEGQFRVHIEPLFPSYVFVETDHPNDFYIALKQVPKLSKLVGADGSFWGFNIEEEPFLDSMFRAAELEKGKNEERYLVRRSLVRTDAHGQIVEAEGVLKNYLGQVVKQRLRKRSVIIEIPFLGTKRRIQLGIRLAEDKEEK